LHGTPGTEYHLSRVSRYVCVCAGGMGGGDESRKKTVEDRGLVPMGHKYAESNGYVIDDVT